MPQSMENVLLSENYHQTTPNHTKPNQTKPNHTMCLNYLELSNTYCHNPWIFITIGKLPSNQTKPHYTTTTTMCPLTIQSFLIHIAMVFSVTSGKYIKGEQTNIDIIEFNFKFIELQNIPLI